MNSSSFKFVRIALCLAVVASYGCVDELGPEAATFEVKVGHELELPTADERLFTDDFELIWSVREAPAASLSSVEAGGLGAAVFLTDTRGSYVIDRVVKSGVSELWTHRYFIEAINDAPVAALEGEEFGRVDEPMVIDASGSTDTETTELEYSWRVLSRPQGSQAGFGDSEAVVVTFIPDVAGIYKIELAVFDGELWSEEDAHFEFLARIAF